MVKNDTYSDQFCDWLVSEGFTHCFFLAGGNIMHLLNAARNRFICVPVVHEVAACIAVEYFNESSDGGRAFALVTAGPGITNSITGIAGAWLENREMLVVGGQVKSSDLASGLLRQRGIQEVDGITLTASITKKSIQITKPISRKELQHAIGISADGKPGPVFIEFCLDAQAAPQIETDLINQKIDIMTDIELRQDSLGSVLSLLSSSNRPILLIGSGISRITANNLIPDLNKLGIPLMTTWNAFDRIDSDNPLYWGRPHTWGQRSANVLIQQSDLVIAIGARLTLAQTGFNWEGFVPKGKIVQIEVDPSELSKGHPSIELGIQANPEAFLKELIKQIQKTSSITWGEWRSFGTYVKKSLPNNEDSNSKNPKFINPYDFVEKLSLELTSEDIVVPCSSGGAFTTMMQAFLQKSGQKIITNMGLASMGYGLSGAIGAAYANRDSRIILVEGDGGFAQNLQELGTVATQDLPIKIFLYENGGYASIKMTQSNYFGGAYVGCDIATGLGMPD
jgi:acetolactate synthase-1/2/3 large subunit